MSEHAKTALTGVRVFDGRQLSDPSTVVIDGERIGTDASGARVVDGRGAVLLPGLIDAHIHLHGRETLEQLCSWGVTTALDMATWPLSLLNSLRGVPGLTDIRSAGTSAIGPGGPHANIPGLPPDAIVRDPGQAARFVATRVSEGSDYIKVVAEAPGRGGPDPATLEALVTAAHAHGKKVIAHAVTSGAIVMALDAGVDVVTHAPLDRPLEAGQVARMAAGHRVAVPTLTMMEGTAVTLAPTGVSFASAAATVTALHRAGVLILAGTDANAQPGVPFHPRHGESLHRELELLVEAVLSPAEALRAATSRTARYFGLTDRGVIEPGRRADLVLIDGDPLAGIRATRNIARVWCAGTEHGPA